MSDTFVRFAFMFTGVLCNWLCQEAQNIVRHKLSDASESKRKHALLRLIPSSLAERSEFTRRIRHPQLSVSNQKCWIF